MNPREGEPKRFPDVFKISPKTSSEQLQKWSKEFWPSDARKRVAEDIVKNGKELFGDIDWESVLKSIRVQRPGGARHLGEAAIAANDAITIGGLGAVANWPTHHPAIVYLSGICLADRIESGGELEDLKSRMRQITTSYGQDTLLPHADSYMRSLDFLLGVKDRSKHRNTINKLQVLLRDGDIETAYNTVKSRGTLVRMRGPVFSNTTTSSIRTPPKPGM